LSRVAEVTMEKSVTKPEAGLLVSYPNDHNLNISVAAVQLHDLYLTTFTLRLLICNGKEFPSFLEI
jgi:hypothetical protein